MESFALPNRAQNNIAMGVLSDGDNKVFSRSDSSRVGLMFFQMARKLRYILGGVVTHDTLVQRAVRFDVQTVADELVAVPDHIDHCARCHFGTSLRDMAIPHNI